MITYKIVESTIDHFKNIELPLDFSNSYIGENISILGMLMNITQIGTDIVACANRDNVLVFQKL